MPILHVEIVTRPAEQVRPTLAKELADAAGLVFGSQPAGTWVQVRSISADQYAEGPGNGPGMWPIFVHVLKAALPDADTMRKEVSQLTALVAELCNRPGENIHILYEPEGRGRVAFGGQLLED